jgi:nanoRNase/pAp phosphatase (c-di-AMP/oligoRNAs hydrolase)
MGKLYQSHQEFFDKLKDRILIIDHHIEDNYHATHNFKDSQADANCVWLYELLITAGW